MFQNRQQVDVFLQEGITRQNILVIGDVMLDRYYFSEVNRISPEAPVPVARVTSARETLGGAANVAKNLAQLGCGVRLTGISGDDEDRQRLDGLMNIVGINSDGLVRTNRPTTTKIRVIGGHQQIVRLDFEDTNPVSRSIEDKIKKGIAHSLNQDITGVIISDYGKGVCTPGICRFIIQICREKGIPVIVDPKGLDWRKYAGVPFITPNLKELGEAVKLKIKNNDEDVKRAADKVRKSFNIPHVIVTRSEKGLSLISENHIEHIPTRAQEVFDVSGAGDTVIAVLGVALAANLHLADTAHLANLAAGFVVGKLGTYAIHRHELIDVVQSFSNREVQL